MEAGFVALGLVQGALAGLNAIGIVLVWRTTRVLNLAQPALGLVGGVLTGMLVSAAGWSFWWAAPVGVAVGALLGLAAERLVLVRLRDASRVVLLVATVGLAELLIGMQTAVPFAFGGRLPSYDVDVGVSLFIFPVLLKGAHLLVLLALPTALAGVWWWTQRTRVGIAAVAAGQDVERAVTLGVPVGFVRAVAWSIAGALSGVAGVLAIPVLGFSLGDGAAPTVLLLAVAPAVLAGLRSLPRAAAAALVVGVAYQVVLVAAPMAGLADLLLATAIVMAVALQRRRLSRVEASTRATSWEAATSPRPLPRAVREDPRWRTVARVSAAAVVVVAALPPLWLSPSGDVRYGTAAALCMGAVAVAVAWTFAGQIALGHWGLAAAGAAVAAVLPAPLPVRAAAAGLVVAAAGALLGLVDRRPGGLAGPVTGLAVAVAAPVGMLALGQVSLDTDAQAVAQVAGAATAFAAIAMAWLRGRRWGIRAVAARDEPRRASGFGIDARRTRLAAMALSAALAGVAGALYLAAVPAGLAPGAFAADRSLELLALTVVGGLGAPLGAAAGAAGLLVAATVLPSMWGALTTGVGVLAVVLFAPAGVGAALTAARDWLARIITARPSADGALAPEAGATTSQTSPSDAAVMDVDIVAGSDTRDALATPTVRAALTAAFFMAGPAFATLLGMPVAFAEMFGLRLAGSRPWVVLGTAAAMGAVATAAARRPTDSGRQGIPAEVAGLVGAAIAALAFALLGDAVLATLALPFLVLAAGWIFGLLVQFAREAVVPVARAAAGGVVIATGLSGGMVGAIHLLTLAGSDGLLAALPWAAAYLLVAAAGFARTAARLPSDAAGAASRIRRAPFGRIRAGTLRVSDLTVRYGQAAVLHDVSLDIRPGEQLALVGGNGTGKSTLLRAIAGLVPAATGQIRLAGRDLTILRPDHRAGAGIAFVSGARPVFPDLTVAENLRVGAYLTHRSSSSFALATEHVLALVPALAGRLDVRAGVLSGGEQRLLALAQTLYRRPAVLLADELTLGLDRSAQESTLGLLRLFADEGTAVVIVDHDLADLLPRSDRAVVLHDGRATTVEEPADLEAGSITGALSATFLTGAGA